MNQAEFLAKIERYWCKQIEPEFRADYLERLNRFTPTQLDGIYGKLVEKHVFLPKIADVMDAAARELGIVAQPKRWSERTAEQKDQLDYEQEIFAKVTKALNELDPDQRATLLTAEEVRLRHDPAFALPAIPTQMSKALISVLAAASMLERLRKQLELPTLQQWKNRRESKLMVVR